MPQKKTSTLQFPDGGLNRKFAYQAQPPFTTPDALNVRPAGTIEKRHRGGSRPGLVKAYNRRLVTQHAGAVPFIQSLASLQVARSTAIEGEQQETWVLPFPLLDGKHVPELPFDTPPDEPSVFWLRNRWQTGWIQDDEYDIAGDNTVSPLGTALHTLNTVRSRVLRALFVRQKLDFNLQRSVKVRLSVRTFNMPPPIPFAKRRYFIYLLTRPAVTIDPYQEGLIFELRVQQQGLDSAAVDVIATLFTGGTGREIARDGGFISPRQVSLEDVVNQAAFSVFDDYFFVTLVHHSESGQIVVTVSFGKTESELLLTNAGTESFVGLDLNNPGHMGLGMLNSSNPVEPGSTADDIASENALGAAIHDWTINYFPVSDAIPFDSNINLLVAASDGWLYRNLQGLMVQVQTAPLSGNPADPIRLAHEYPLEMAERGQKLFIADYLLEPIAEGEGNLLVSSRIPSSYGELILDSTDPVVANWPGEFPIVDRSVHVIAISNSRSDDPVGGTYYNMDGTYQFEVRDGSPSELLIDLGYDDDEGFEPEVGIRTDFVVTPCHYVITRGPKIYDPKTITKVSHWLTREQKGGVPVDCKLVTRYNDRLVLAGQITLPHAWYMSRQGDPHDFDYGSETFSGSAVAGTTSEAGTVGEPIIALIPASDDYLIFGCLNSLWIMRGDPTYGGQLEVLSTTIGVVTPRAWAFTPGGTLVFLSRFGLFKLAPGGRDFPQEVSHQDLPDELIDVHQTQARIELSFDSRFNGIHIYISHNNQGESKHYWFDWTKESFWPVSLQWDHDAVALYDYQAVNQAEAHLLLGSRDGYIRRYDRNAPNDDGLAFTTKLVYGPLRLGIDDAHDGLIKDVIGILGEESLAVNWSLRVGNHAQAAFDASPVVTGTWSPGRNRNARPRRRGAAAFLEMTNAALDGHPRTALPWSLESIVIERQTAGKTRL